MLLRREVLSVSYAVLRNWASIWGYGSPSDIANPSARSRKEDGVSLVHHEAKFGLPMDRKFVGSVRYSPTPGERGRYVCRW